MVKQAGACLARQRPRQLCEPAERDLSARPEVDADELHSVLGKPTAGAPSRPRRMSYCKSCNSARTGLLSRI
jgi:hypothetical protein